MDDMGGDCSTDGTCEADSGDPEMSEGNAAGEKVSLLQGTSLAIQQFSISKSIAFAIEEHQMAAFYWSPMLKWDVFLAQVSTLACFFAEKCRK